MSGTDVGLDNEPSGMFVNKLDCITKFKNKKVYVFGTGVDAEELQNELVNQVEIVAYIDNYRFGEDHIFYGKKIMNLSQCLEQRSSEEPIIVASYRYGIEICKQLNESGLVSGKDYFLWDDRCLFHTDENTEKFINFMYNIWHSHKKYGDKKILIAFDNRHELVPVVYAYCANYFAEKYDATIYGYLRGGSSSDNASEVMKRIYKAINMEDIVNTQLSEAQEKEAEEICELLWKNLYTWEDWKNINVYGIDFGTTIIRHFLRVDIPCFDLRAEKMYLFLQKAIKAIVFWYHYINENDIKIVLLADGVQWDGYIRDIAITKGIPTYALCYKMEKLKLNHSSKAECYTYFGEFWNQLSKEEQKYGLQWAKEHIEKRIKGSTEEVWTAHKDLYTFAEKKKNYRVLEDNDKIKVIIFPHIFEEDCFWCGEQIFDNNYFAWLCHLGELSEKRPDYDWYLKMHPNAQRRDKIIIDKLLKKYSKIKLIPANVSPVQLKEEGAKFALTNHGTIGHELPEIGIQVINAGRNPHIAYNFTWNPKTKEEYDNLIMNLDKLNLDIDYEELYKFYSLNYLFYDWEYVDFRTIFFTNPKLAMSEDELKAHGERGGTWMYREYMQEWTQEKHNEILEEMDEVFKKLDEWKPDVFYKKEIIME